MISATAGGGQSKTGKSIFDRVLPDCYIYVSHLDQDAQFWPLPIYPDSVSDNMNSTFSEQNALGRSAPIYTYSNSGPRSIQLTLKFHRDMVEEACEGKCNVVLRDGEDYSDAFIRVLQSIALPRYNLDNKAVEPPLIAVRLGSQVFIKGIVNGGVNVTYEKPILVNEKYASITVSFTVYEVDPYDSSSVYTNGSFRGLVDSLKQGMGME